ncbi:MAG: hypothetical protein DME04_23855 [Candidatus Rokuibacteriota bacterium]|nr:MAG: hypothetical protein DME04_23855 [Candidatus Rokubacteria bacterium]
MAHPAAVRESDRAVIGRTLALVLVLAHPVAAQALDVQTERYQAAATAGAVGTLTGRVFDERRRPAAAERPLSGVSVILLPRSAEFLRKLDEVKRKARDSANEYRASAPAILSLKAGYEKALWEAGAADLVKATAVDSDGRFTIENLPAGDWVLIATHSVSVEKHGIESDPGRRRNIYTPGSRLTGYQVVAIWLHEISVTKGSAARVDLMDRNVWLSGIVEDRTPGAGR